MYLSYIIKVILVNLMDWLRVLLENLVNLLVVKLRNLLSQEEME